MRIKKKTGYGILPMLLTYYFFVDATLPNTKGWPTRAFLAKCVEPLFSSPELLSLGLAGNIRFPGLVCQQCPKRRRRWYFFGTLILILLYIPPPPPTHTNKQTHTHPLRSLPRATPLLTPASHTFS